MSSVQAEHRESDSGYREEPLDPTSIESFSLEPAQDPGTNEGNSRTANFVQFPIRDHHGFENMTPRRRPGAAREALAELAALSTVPTQLDAGPLSQGVAG